MTYTSILIETRDKVGLIVINRPQALNALNHTLMTELMDALDAFDNNEAIGAMVITGSEKAFAAGADIKEMADKSALQMTREDHIAVFGRIRAIRKPVIAAVSGWALGGGFELALSCDMIVASDTVKFGLPEITLGVIPGAGGHTATRPRGGESLCHGNDPQRPKDQRAGSASFRTCESSRSCR
jgi:enoyl-CoA hydratase